MRSLVFQLLPFVLTAAVATADPPRTVYWNGQGMEQVRTAARDKSSPHAVALQQLRRNADQALRRGPYSVVAKKLVPPSGDKHDYMSFGPYWWPNPETPDGLPYVRRDGKHNPAAKEGCDSEALGDLCKDVQMLSLADYFLDDDRYSRRAVKLLRTWFLAPETRMNPHLEFGQAIPGKTTGRGVGIIDTRTFIELLDGVEVLRATDELSASDLSGLQSWFREYLHWLRMSDLGVDERRANNNHGTWYDAQCARFAIFVGDAALARDIVAAVGKDRIDRQLEPDGRQPEELARTKSFTYSAFNLEGLCTLARAGEAVDVDLWNYRSSDGRSIRAAFDFLMPYLEEKEKWPYEQIGDSKLSNERIAMLRIAADRLGERRYAEVAERLWRRNSERSYVRLLWP